MGKYAVILLANSNYSIPMEYSYVISKMQMVIVACTTAGRMPSTTRNGVEDGLQTVVLLAGQTVEGSKK